VKAVAACVRKIWRLKDNGVTILTFWGHVTSSVMWPFDSRWSTSYGWSIVTMRLSGTVTKIWLFEVLPERLFQEQRSVVGRSSTLHWSQSINQSINRRNLYSASYSPERQRL